MSEYEVELYVHGPVAVKKRVILRELKGRNPDDLFHSDISINNTQSGVLVNLTARTGTENTDAKDEELATKAAYQFLGQTLDVLALYARKPLYLSLFDRPPSWPKAPRTRLRIDQDHWHDAFEGARDLSDREPLFLRALSWFRKALYTEDPLDKFLAYWNSIENVASKYHPKEPCEGRGTKCYIWECFKLIWGDCDQWPVVRGNRNWIDENYGVRKNIAHGAMSVSIRRVDEILQKLDTIDEVSHRFLSDWRAQRT